LVLVNGEQIRAWQKKEMFAKKMPFCNDYEGDETTLVHTWTHLSPNVEQAQHSV